MTSGHAPDPHPHSREDTDHLYTITRDAPGPLSGVCGFTVTITTCTSNYDSWVPCGKHGPELFV